MLKRYDLDAHRNVEPKRGSDATRIRELPALTVVDCFVLGGLGSLLGPAGDLCESMIKRDLGIKDMGTVLPGHGGILDRIDAMLFVIPAVYFLAIKVL